MLERSISLNNIYYVYAYLNEDGTPYYIGKGKKDRYKTKHKVPVPTDPNKIVFLEKNLTEIGALAIEKRMIEWYGRSCKSNGILLNVSSGGTGRSSEKRKQKRSFARAGWNWDLI
jgi:hypothetical protein